MELIDIIREFTFSGLLVKMNEDYTPIGVNNKQPFNSTHTLFDYSLMKAEQSNNIYVFKPYNPSILSLCAHRDEIINALSNIEKIYMKPITFTEEMNTEQFLVFYLLKIPVDEVYESILPSKYRPKSKELLEQIIIQSARETVLSSESKYSSIFFNGEGEFSFHFNSPSLSRALLWRYVVEDLLPSIKEILGYSTLNNIKNLFQEGYYSVYPEFRIDEDIINITVHTIRTSNPDDHQKHNITINMNDIKKSNSFDYIYSEYPGHIALTGNIFNFFKSYKDKFVQVTYDLLKRKGKMIIIRDGIETVIDTINEVHMDTQKLYIDDEEFSLNNISVIRTSQYYLTKEKVLNNLFDDNTLEKASELFEDFLKKRKILFNYEHMIINSKLFGVMLG